MLKVTTTLFIYIFLPPENSYILQYRVRARNTAVASLKLEGCDMLYAVRMYCSLDGLTIARSRPKLGMPYLALNISPISAQSG